ncbi:MAG: biotin transporter BioY, partial [Rhodobacteraceae bacterium]|nr:biotin transporter BioY [Paracoccaceae bacterium]
LVGKFRARSFVPLALACAGGGIVAVYAVGVPWMSAVGRIGFGPAALASLAFVPGDIIKALIAAKIVQAVQRGYPLGPA